MLTFECCLQQLLGLCIERLDFILLSTRLPHGIGPAALYWAGLGTAPGEEGRGRGRPQMWRARPGFPDCTGPAGLATAWDRYSWAVLGI